VVANHAADLSVAEGTVSFTINTSDIPDVADTDLISFIDITGWAPSVTICLLVRRISKARIS
jgi:hypothetical protein